MYATLEDVRLILGVAEDETRDAKLTASLAAAESWVATRLKKLAASGSQVETYFDVSEDATLHLPSEDALVTLLKVYEYPSANGIPLSPIELGAGHGYDVTDEGDVYLRPTLGVSPFEGASASRPLRQYARVEVYYEASGLVPAAVTRGVAYLAAGDYTNGPRALAGLRSEKIGDYAYTRDAVGEDGQPEYTSIALFWLTPFLRRSRLAVV